MGWGRWGEQTRQGISVLFLIMGVVVHFVDVAQAVPPIPQNLLPANGVSNISKNPTLEISCNSPDVVAAQYVIAMDSGFTNIVYDSLETVNDLCSHVALAQLNSLSQYYWRARVRDGQGVWSNWSSGFNFTTNNISNLFFNVFQDGVGSYSGTRDADIRGSFADQTQAIREWNQGKQDVLRTGRRPAGRPTDEIYRSLLKFDLSALKNSSSVITAYLEFTGYEHGPANDNVVFNGANSLYQVLKNWGEGQGVVNDFPQSGEVSWTFSAHPNQWSVPGAAHASDNDPAADRKSSPLVQMVVTNEVGFRTLWSSQDFVETVKEWIDNPGANKGLLLKADDESFQLTMHIASREHPDPIFRPKLVIVSTEEAFPSENQPPLVVRDRAITDMNTQVSIPVLTNDFDQDNAPASLTITDVGIPNNGSANIVGDHIVYLPDIGFSGIETIWYTVTDGETNASAMVHIDVGNMSSGNQAPVVTDDSYNVDQDAILTIETPGILGNDSDANNDPLTAVLETPPSAGGLTLEADGGFTYTPTAGFSGTDSFTYHAHDGQLDSPSATVTLTVIPEGGIMETVTFQQGVAGYSSVQDTFIRGADPTGHNAHRPMVKWSTTESKYGLISFGDLFGAGAGQIPAEATIQSATLSLQVYNSGIAADIYESAVAWSETVTFDSFGGDPDVQGEERGSLVEAGDGVGVSDGPYLVDVTTSLVQWHADPSRNHGWIFMPTDSDDVAFHSSEYGTTTERPQLTVTYVIGGGNQPPQAVDDTYTGTEATVLTVAAPGVLGNDSDPNNDPLTAVLETPPSAGGLTLEADGGFTYTPTAGFSGTDSFTYHAHDGQLDSSSVTVTLTMNEAPVAVDDSATTQEAVVVTIPVLANDTDDVGLNAASVTVQSGPSKGTTSVDTGTGDITYIPNPGYSGPDSFTYTVRDTPGLESNVAMVTVEVTQSNGAPVAVQDSYTGTEATVLTVAAPGVLGNDSDPNNDPLTAVLETPPSAGGLTLEADGGFTYTPTAGFSGTDSFTYHAHDGQVDSASVTVTLDINPSGGTTATVTFQQGVEGYSGTVDTFIRGAAPDQHSSHRPLSVWSTAEDRYALVRFEDIFGTGLGQIPAGATIQSATLILEIFDPGAGGNIYESTVEWIENVTHNSFGGDPGVQADELGALVQSAETDLVPPGVFNVDVTDSLSHWVSNPENNQGWIFAPNGSDDVRFRTSEYGSSTVRPKLSVTYSVNGGN